MNLLTILLGTSALMAVGLVRHHDLVVGVGLVRVECRLVGEVGDQSDIPVAAADDVGRLSRRTDGRLAAQLAIRRHCVVAIRRPRPVNE